MRHPRAHTIRGRSTVSPHRPGRRLLAVAALTVGVLLPVAVPAFAHDALLGSEPADGDVLAEAPSQVVLIFEAAQAGLGSEVAVIGPDAGAWTDGPAQVAGAVVTQPLRAGMPDGDYAVTWRSVSGDGHPVSGTFGFSVAVEAAPVVEATAPVVEQPTAGVTTAAPSALAATAAPSAEVSATAPVGLGWLVAGGTAALVAVALVRVLRRRSVADG